MVLVQCKLFLGLGLVEAVDNRLKNESTVIVSFCGRIDLRHSPPLRLRVRRRTLKLEGHD